MRRDNGECDGIKYTFPGVFGNGRIRGLSICKHNGLTLKAVRVRNQLGKLNIFCGLRKDTFSADLVIGERGYCDVNSELVITKLFRT